MIVDNAIKQPVLNFFRAMTNKRVFLVDNHNIADRVSYRKIVAHDGGKNFDVSAQFLEFGVVIA